MKAERMSETIGRWAWKVSGDYSEGWHIGCLSTDLAKDLGVKDLAYYIADAIQWFLENNAEELYESGGGPERSTHGRCYISDDEVYFQFTNGTSEWYIDEPECWKEVQQPYLKDALMEQMEYLDLTAAQIEYIESELDDVDVLYDDTIRLKGTGSTMDKAEPIWQVVLECDGVERHLCYV